MKKILLFILAIISTICHAQEWVSVWNEEFDYVGLPDENKWNYETGCAIRNNEAQYYAAKRVENTNVENGFLTITARKETMNGCAYTSGAINTKYKADWLYGKIEVRAKLPKGKGMWPAIWMMSTDETYGYWPRSGEIDIMESVGYDPNKIFMTIHTEAYNHVINTEKGSSVQLQNVYDTYHIYSIEWMVDRVDFFIDGIKYYSFNKSGETSAVWPFNKPFYMILNVAVGGDWGGIKGIDESIFPQQMSVDYVRVYKWQTNPGPYVLNITSTAGGSITNNPIQVTYPKGTNVSLKAMPIPGYVFAGWLGDKQGMTNPLNIVVNDNVNIKALFKPECELSENGNFISGSRQWTLYSADGGIAQQITGNEKNTISISKGGTNVWSIQLSQGNIPLENGKMYKLSFDAYSDINRTIKAGVGKNSDPYNTYAYYNTSLTTSTKSYSYTFKMNNATDNESKILFDIGANDGDVFLTNISLCDLSILTSNDQDNFASKEIAQAYYLESYLNVKFPKNGKYNISLFKTSGELLKHEMVTSENYKLNINLAAGIYLVKIIEEGERSKTLKLVVQD